MSKTVDPKRVQDLVLLLQDMTAGYEQLAELVQEYASRLADVPRLRIRYAFEASNMPKCFR